MKLFFTFLGLLFIFEGLPYVACPEAMRRWLLQLIQMRPALLRVMGLLAMGGGLLICYLTQRTDLFR